MATTIHCRASLAHRSLPESVGFPFRIPKSFVRSGPPSACSNHRFLAPQPGERRASSQPLTGRYDFFQNNSLSNGVE